MKCKCCGYHHNMFVPCSTVREKRIEQKLDKLLTMLAAREEKSDA